MAVFVTDYCTLGQLQFWVTFGEVSERKWLASNECVEKAASGTSSFPRPAWGRLLAMMKCSLRRISSAASSRAAARRALRCNWRFAYSRSGLGDCKRPPSSRSLRAPRGIDPDMTPANTKPAIFRLHFMDDRRDVQPSRPQLIDDRGDRDPELKKSNIKNILRL
jgi:hypothetical protein